MSETPMDQDDIDPEILAAFLDDADEALLEMDACFVDLETLGADPERVNAIFRTVHSIKGNSAFFGLMRVKQLAHAMEDLLALVREDKLPISPQLVDALLEGQDLLKEMLARVRARQSELEESGERAFRHLCERLADIALDKPEGGDWTQALHQVESLLKLSENASPEIASAASALAQTLRKLAPLSTAASLPPPNIIAPAVAQPPGIEPSPALDPREPEGKPGAADVPERGELSARTMRVEEAKIDQFLDYVGELIIVREMFGNVGKRLRLLKDMSGLALEFQRALEAFASLSRDLQQSIMDVRTLQVKGVLQKAPRIVRDVASVANKEAKVQLLGSDVRIDKSLLEAFEAPFTHLVRNAIDHGVEPPEVRRESGKPEVANIVVEVTETADEVRFRISDDGRGIDHVAVKAKAQSLGLLDARTAERMGPQQAHELLFHPGLSTAQKVSEISGRGVGMDVVRRNVTDLGGRIEIRSRLGLGTDFFVHLPKAVTVQILDGFLVRVEQHHFVLPLQAINESFRPEEGDLHSVAQKGECIRRRGRVFPLVRFGELLRVAEQRRAVSDAIVVSIDGPGGALAGLLVDDVLGVQQVVLREIDGLANDRAPFLGGAVLGDGRVAMVVDVDRLGSMLSGSASTLSVGLQRVGDNN